MEIRSISSAAGRPVAETGSLSPPGQAIQQAGQSAVQTNRAVQRSAETIRIPSSRQRGEAEVSSVEAERKKAEEAVESITKSLSEMSESNSLQFAIDEELDQVVVKVVDPETQEVLKQFPSEDAIRLAKSLSKLSGNFIRTKS